MTQRLYYTDSFLYEFDAEVVNLNQADPRPAIMLDRTAFYPTSGGQIFDTGWLLPEGIDEHRKLRVVEAQVPLRRMFDYVDKVRSLSQGRASWSMEPHSYAPAPDEVLQGFLHGSETW